MNEDNIIINHHKPWYKRKLFYFLIIGALIVGSVVYGQVKKANQLPVYETAKVTRGELIQTVDASGNVKSANELDLRFETSGRVGKIYKKTNDLVAAGDLIAELNLNELNANVAQASANVQRAQADLNKAQAGKTAEFISSLQARLAKAQADLEQVKLSSQLAIADAKSALNTAENNLKISQGGEDSQIVNDAYGDMLSLLLSAQNVLADGLTQADDILGVDNTLANDSFESALSILNSSKLNTAKTKYYVARASKGDADEAINNLSSSSGHNQIDLVSGLAEDALFSMKDLLFAVAEVLDNTPPVGGVTQASLSVLKTNIQTVRVSVSTKYTALVDQMQAIETAKNSYQSYQIAYDKTVVELDNAKNKAVANVAAYQALVDQARADWDDAKNPLREVDLASYRAALAAANASLAQTVANRNKARIIAPLAGTIGKNDLKIGEYISAQDAAIKLVSPHFEVKVDIPETDIVKITLGDAATITMDAFGSEVKFVGKVMEVQKGETLIQDVVYYSVTLSLEDDSQHEILNGMTANVIFYTENKESVLSIPSRAVRSGDAGKYVRILENGEVKDVPVKVGLRGDGGMVEVVEGLSEGQDVVLNTNGV
jgi:RND family efflux transporter MFP subunit